MKKILIAAIAALSMTAAVAQHHGHRNHDHRFERHDQHSFRIPDQVDRRVIVVGHQRIVVTTTSTCVRQFRDRCARWEKRTSRRVVLR